MLICTSIRLIHTFTYITINAVGMCTQTRMQILSACDKYKRAYYLVINSDQMVVKFLNKCNQLPSDISLLLSPLFSLQRRSFTIKCTICIHSVTFNNTLCFIFCCFKWSLLHDCLIMNYDNLVTFFYPAL